MSSTRCLVIGVALLSISRLFAEPAQVDVGGRFEPDAFKPGIRVYLDRSYAASTPPKELLGRAYMRTPIDGCTCKVVADGELICLTPKAGGPSPCSQDDKLKAAGFACIDEIGEFQLFSYEPQNRVRAWRKEVKVGETFVFAKFVCILAQATHPTLPEPINVDVGRQMFMDDLLVAKRTMRRTWNKPEIDPRSPLLKPETELEKSNNTKDPRWNAMAAPFSGGVWYDGKEKIYKCYYLAGWANGIAYATSKDGITWTRPDLDGKGNNLAIHTKGMCDSNSVLLDPDCTDGYRWKAFMFDLLRSDIPGRRNRGASVTRSKDGIVWDELELATQTGDCSTAFYNPFIGKWVFSVRASMNEGGRAFGRWREYAEGSDFIKDAKNMQKRRWRLRGAAGGRENNGQELYNFDAVAYESVMIGLALVYNSPQNNYWDRRGLPKIADLRFGFNSVPAEYDEWQFPTSGVYDFFLEGTRRYGDWNMGYLRSNSAICIVHGDELWIYFSGFAGDPNKQKEFSAVNQKSGTYANATMGLAKLRRDGFCTLSDGMIRTRRLIFTKGDRLWVNADTRGGELVVSVNGEKAKTIKDVDSTRLEVCPLAPNREFTLTFEARGEAKLYSFWTSDAKGRSGGYLAGGSPESATLRDEE